MSEHSTDDPANTDQANTDQANLDQSNHDQAGHDPKHRAEAPPREGEAPPDVEQKVEETLLDSNPNASGPQGAAGGMGVSSERVGDVQGRERTDGTKDTRAASAPEDAPPEQAPGNVEENPEGLAPKAPYPPLDPRSKD